MKIVIAPNALKGCLTAAEAAEYLEISIATFRRYVQAGKITAHSSVGNAHLYPLAALRALKKAIKLAK